MTRVSYEQLAAGIEKLNVAVAQNHDDVVTLRGYVAAKDGERLLAPTVLPVADAGTVVRSLGAGAGGAYSWPKRPAPAGAAALAPPAPSAAPPPVHEAAPQYHPPKFDAVLKMAD